jgi:hypothetical protein
MKRHIFLVLALLLCSAFTFNLFAQYDPSREILVYFTSGAQRMTKGQAAARLVSNASKMVLARFNIGEDRVTSAFPDFDEADTIKTTPFGKRIGMMNMSRVFSIRVPDGVVIDSVTESLKRLPNVLFAERNMDARLYDDPTYVNQWHLNNTGQSGGVIGADIKAEQAWQIFTGSSSVKIGIFDVGVELTHDDLSGKSTGDSRPTQGNEPDLSHGTHVAGIAAAKANNGYGGRGIDWNAQIVSKQLFAPNQYLNWQLTWLGDANAYNKITAAVNEGVGVLNNSWGGSDKNTAVVHSAFVYAYKMNRISCAAMGNDYNNGNPTAFPAAFSNGVIAVGATDNTDTRAPYSQTGNHIDVTAPGGYNTYPNNDGRDIWSCWKNNDYRYVAGTSMATPIVSGIASLLKGYSPNLYNDDIQHVIELSADDKGPVGWDPEYGYGRVNARKALDLLRSPYVLTQSTTTGGTDQGGSSYYTIAIFGAQPWGLSDGWYTVKRHEVRKTISYASISSAAVWGRGPASSGWADDNGENYAYGWCDAVPGTVTSSSAQLRTYVYEVWYGAQYMGWYPTTPGNVTFAYTVLGIPCQMSVGISGPTVGPCNTGTWTASVSCGAPPYSYQWYRMWTRGGGTSPSQQSSGVQPLVPCGVWTSVGTGNPLQLYWCGGDGYLRVDVTDAQQHLVSAQYFVQGAGGGGAQANRTNDEPRFKVSLPKEYSVASFPNPFNPTTTITYQLVEDAKVRLEVYDLTGRMVASLLEGEANAGSHSVMWKGTDQSGNALASGVYLYRFWAQPLSGHSAFLTSGKLVMMK